MSAVGADGVGGMTDEVVVRLRARGADINFVTGKVIVGRETATEVSVTLLTLFVPRASTLEKSKATFEKSEDARLVLPGSGVEAEKRRPSADGDVRV